MVKITIHAFGEGECSLSGKEVPDGLLVTFDDGTLEESLLSTKSLLQLVRLKLGAGNGTKKPEARPSAAPVAEMMNE